MCRLWRFHPGLPDELNTHNVLRELSGLDIEQHRRPVTLQLKNLSRRAEGALRRRRLTTRRNNQTVAAYGDAFCERCELRPFLSAGPDVYEIDKAHGAAVRTDQRRVHIAVNVHLSDQRYLSATGAARGQLTDFQRPFPRSRFFR